MEHSISMILGNYIEDYTQTKIPSPYGPLDENGIPLFALKFVRSKLTRSNGDLIYHPIVIIQYGLAHHTLWQSGDPSAEETFFACAQWLETNADWEPQGRFVAWYYPYSVTLPKIDAPWISGMAQGQAISLLLRAYQYTDSTSTMRIVKQAAQSFLYEVCDGGILSSMASGYTFIEEYAARPEIHVLNGCLFGLLGLFEYLKIFPDSQLQATMESCLLGIEEALPCYDLDWWSLYSLGLRWNIANFHYHHVHVFLLSYLGECLDSSLFLEYARRWRRYEHTRKNRLRRRLLDLFIRPWNRALMAMGLSKLRCRKSNIFED